MKNLFVTSFDREMFAATGAVLAISFLDFVSEGTLLVCHEGFESSVIFQHPGLLAYDLRQAPLLRQWLADNRDIIPTHLGGTAGICGCPDPDNPFGPHRAGCHWQWFNKNASRWFRKVVSLDYALELRGYDSMIWVDSDCRFRKRLPEGEVERWFGGKSVFYLKSPDRDVLESGVLGLRTTMPGMKFVRAAVERYRTGAFRNDVRWDDAFQFQRSLETHPEIESIDLAVCATGTKPYGHVLAHSPAGEYIVHRKGFHGSKLGLMR
ncbi:hypothetical protein SBA4_3410004 [Candidatus Sulfopaludibacter sp. SbA4]|nr:hypothetical protein SBA4_3410004 [Candidatus Sulfopaludibacter sp. SbA4]